LINFQKLIALIWINFCIPRKTVQFNYWLLLSFANHSKIEKVMMMMQTV